MEYVSTSCRTFGVKFLWHDGVLSLMFPSSEMSNHLSMIKFQLTYSCFNSIGGKELSKKEIQESRLSCLWFSLNLYRAWSTNGDVGKEIMIPKSWAKMIHLPSVVLLGLVIVITVVVIVRAEWSIVRTPETWITPSSLKNINITAYFHRTHPCSDNWVLINIKQRLLMHPVSQPMMTSPNPRPAPGSFLLYFLLINAKRKSYT